MRYLIVENECTYRLQRAQQRIRALIAPSGTRLYFWSVYRAYRRHLLRKVTNENFGTFSFQPQLSATTACIYMWCLDVKHNSRSGN